MIKLRHIIIVGLGLIGGSLAAACRKKFPKARVLGVTRNRAALVAAKKRKWIHEGSSNLNHVFGSANPYLVVLCTPVDTLKGYLKRLDAIAPSGTIVTDVGSVKGFLVRWVDRRNWRRIHYVGAHPMAGSHERGIDHACPDLFDHALTFVTPPRNAGATRRLAPPIKTVIHFWRRVCRRVVVISPERHDCLTAEISHLPHLVASLLVESVSHQALRFAATGFLDTTRIAQGDPDLWLPIFAGNKKELSRALLHFESRLKQMKKILQGKDFSRLRKVLAQSMRRRQDINKYFAS